MTQLRLTLTDRLEQGVSLNTSHTHTQKYTSTSLKDKAPGSELLLKVMDARNTPSHIEPRTTMSLSLLLTHTHTHARILTAQFDYPVPRAADRKEIITEPQLIKPCACIITRCTNCDRPLAHALKLSAVISISESVRLCVSKIGFLSPRGGTLVKGEEFY